MSTKSAINAKVFEPKINEYLSKLIYAVFDDITREWNGQVKYSNLIYQNYQNLLLDKKSRSDGLKNRFSVSSEVRQYITMFFVKMVNELSTIEIGDNDTIATLSEKLDAAYAPECYTTFMWGVGTQYKTKWGATLKSAGDSTQWFQGKIIEGPLCKYATSSMIIALISTAFDSFLKSVAWLLGTLLWYYPVPISSDLFLGVLKQQSLNQIMLDELASQLREKPPTKPRAKKGASSGTPSTSSDSSATPDHNDHDDIDDVQDSDLSDVIANV